MSADALIPASPVTWDFDEDAPAAEQGPTFRLCGQAFQLRAMEDIPFGTIIKIFRELNGSEDSEVALQVGPLFRATLTSESGKRFVDLMEQEDSPLTLRRVQPVTERIFEYVTNRPTKPVRDSSAGSKRTGRNSRARSSSPGTRPKASTG